MVNCWILEEYSKHSFSSCSDFILLPEYCGLSFSKNADLNGSNCVFLTLANDLEKEKEYKGDYVCP